MTYMMLYVLPMILGRTYDLAKETVGVDIFTSSIVSNPVVINKASSETRYRLVDSMHEARDFLDVGGSFSLKVKGGMFNAGASGSYLTDNSDRENTVELLVHAVYETITETLPSRTRAIPDWQLTAGNATHYVRSITYGGELLVSVQMRCKGSRAKQHVKASLELGGRVQIFDVEGEVEGEYLKDVSTQIDETDIKLFSSVPVGFVPHSMKDLELLLNTFADDVKRYNGGKGVPLRVELWPLTSLDASRHAFFKNRVLETRLSDFEERMDDLLNTRRAVDNWLHSLDTALSLEQERQVGAFYSELESVLDLFYETIGLLDITGGVDQLQRALAAYNTDGPSLPNSYYTGYLELRKEVTRDVLRRKTARSRGTTYIRWGSSACGSGGAELVQTGYAAGPPARSVGGGANFLCLPEDPRLQQPGTEQSVVGGVNYIVGLDASDSGRLRCALCRLADYGAVRTVAGTATCPKEWTRLHGGVLAESGPPSRGNEFLCLDDDRNAEKPTAAHPADPWLNVTWVVDGQPQLVPCSVCAL